MSGLISGEKADLLRAAITADGFKIAGTISAGSIAIDEFPAAAALSDTFANPTTTSVASMLMGYDGSTWERLKGDGSGNLKVTLGTKLDAVNDSITTKASAAYSTNITTATTTPVFSFPGVIREIEVLGGTLGNVTVYDNTAASGTVIAAAFTPIAGQVFARNVVCAVGCTIVTAAATALLVKWEAQ